MLLVQLKPADVACGKATLRTSPLSGQVSTSSPLRHRKPLACHSGAALGALECQNVAVAISNTFADVAPRPPIQENRVA